jgi:hypothetical protein
VRAQATAVLSVPLLDVAVLASLLPPVRRRAQAGDLVFLESFKQVRLRLRRGTPQQQRCHLRRAARAPTHAHTHTRRRTRGCCCRTPVADAARTHRHAPRTARRAPNTPRTHARRRARSCRRRCRRCRSPSSPACCWQRQ